jgi:hypothetical protein
MQEEMVRLLDSHILKASMVQLPGCMLVNSLTQEMGMEMWLDIVSHPLLHELTVVYLEHLLVLV